jgi:hypothetical protein
MERSTYEPALMKPRRSLLFFHLILFLPALPSGAAEPVHPGKIEFRREAVRRLVFDAEQAIPLASLRPASVHDFDLMHPELEAPRDGGSAVTWKLEDGGLSGKSAETKASSLRWIGGFNPFATYDLVVTGCEGSGSTGLAFRNATTGDRMTANLHYEKGLATRLSWEIGIGGAGVDFKEWVLPDALEIGENDPLTLRVQMVAVGVNLLLERSGRSTLIGHAEFSEHVDLREKKEMRRYDFGMETELTPGSEVRVGGATAALTPGSGQADIRAITDREGNALLESGRLWFTVTVRGRALPHPLQGVISLDPSTFDLQFEGIIVFDMGDGLLRNELASHLFFDSEAGEWHGWTTGFSALGAAGRKEEKTILAVSSTRDPRKGFSIMRAKPIGLDGAHEDPHGVYDADAKKWRLLLCESHEKYRAGLWESDHWDRGFERLSGPVPMDSTGTMIQNFGGTRYALFGSADRKVYVATYPDLEPAGELQLYLPPWDDRNTTRIWPNVIPLPEGYPAPYIALMMDRVNFPGMPKPNWTYGALYLYHGHLPE